MSLFVVDRHVLDAKEVSTIPWTACCCNPKCHEPLRRFTPLVQRPIVRLGTTGIMGHASCFPAAQTWQERLLGGIRATAQGFYGGISAHPVKSALIGIACVGVAFCTVKMVEESSADFHTYCIQDASNHLWCVSKKVTESASGRMFERLEPVQHWVHSGDFTQRSYDQLKGGIEVVLDVTRKYFVQNPFRKFF